MRTGIKGILFDLDNTLIDRQAAADAKIRKLVDALFPQLREEPVERENVVQKLLTWDEYGSIEKIHMYSMLAKEYGFTYLGGHPMAGTHNSGFKYATSTMFHNAPMVLVPADHNDIDLLSRVKELLVPAGFGRFSITTAEQHDEMIAFTSQLAHVVSNAYIKSPTAELHKGFSAGSYKDMTRVAWLAPEMWAELFLENKDFLMAELDTLMANLRQYQDAMVHNDLPGLVRLLDEGRKRKEEVDGR